MIISYKNNRNQTVNLDQEPYFMAVSDFLDYEWDYSESHGVARQFYRSIKTRKLKIDVYGDTERSARKNQNILTEIFEYDIAKKAAGRLYVGEYWLPCYIIACAKTDWEDTTRMVSCEYTLLTESGMWMKKTEYHFRGVSGEKVGGFDFPYDFPVDFVSAVSANRIMNDAVSESNMELRIYGPADKPAVIIGDHMYGVRCTVADHEIVKINTKNRKALLIHGDGGIENIFPFRNREQYIYDPVPAGESVVSTNGFFDHDVILLTERSEPEWT